MIKVKLREMEHDPANVQVIVGSNGWHILMWRDEDFLSITELLSIEIPNYQKEDQGSSNKHIEEYFEGHDQEDLYSPSHIVDHYNRLKVQYRSI